MPVRSPQMPRKLAASALAIFSRDGIDVASLDQVARHAGVTKGSLYWHYKDKRDLILAACQHYYESYSARIQAEMARETDPLLRLRRVVRFSVRSCLIDRANRAFTTEIFALSLRDIDVRNSWRQFYAAVRELYVGLVQTATGAGCLRCSDPRRAVDLMLEAMEGIKLRAMFEPHICDQDEQLAITRQLLGILGTDEISK